MLKQMGKKIFTLKKKFFIPKPVLDTISVLKIN